MANEVRQIATTGLQTVPVLLATINATSYAEGVVIGNQRERTGGNVFVWRATGTANNGTVYPALTSGYWHMQFPNGFVDARWFGAHPTATATANTTAILAAFTFARDNNLNLFVSEGVYNINSLLLEVENGATSVPFTFYGAGASKTEFIYSGSGIGLYFKARYNRPVQLDGFSIIGTGTGAAIGTGMKLNGFTMLTVRDLYIGSINLALDIENVNVCSFEALRLTFNAYAIKAQASVAPPYPGLDSTLPNVLNFISCTINSNTICAVQLYDMHSINFQSCDISANGEANNNVTPMIQVAGIDCSYLGNNGGNGLNVNDCYFEGNIGLADIRLQVLNPGGTHTYYGTHTFTGNTFNRNIDRIPANTGNPYYTTNNILVTGTGQYVKPTYKPVFGQGKSRLVFKGNGFFVNVPGAPNNYRPEPSRRAIQIDYYTDDLGNKNYWEFDILEEGNTYAGLDDAPIYSNPADMPPSYRVFDDKTPQVSEYTRAKAFGYFRYNRESRSYDILNSYNIERIIINDRPPGIIGEEENTQQKAGLDSGSISIQFANELQTIPLPVMLNHDEPEEAVWGVIHSFRYLQSTGVTLDIYDFNTKARVQTSFVLVVF